MPLEVKEKINNLIELADGIQLEANKHNIIHVFDDGGYRELLLVKMFGLTRIPGRHGDDGIDPLTGNQYELKTVNLIDTKGEVRKKPGITTCHHVNHEIIRRYRAVTSFLVGIFYINKPARIYEVPSEELEDYFTKWEYRLNNEANLNHINNPKISFCDIIDKGILHYHDQEFDSHFASCKQGIINNQFSLF
ncbi:hypothetical protein [Bacillus pumilus]|uniref:hypothetical protein n=1 Tax=Bacillus pumilus TaxID=1408 RepID=UPI002864CA1E|nr:hypothetical protein [Bacillus pumilus]MDR7247356.1 hypothetical protein [Bacillus pumilus]